MYLQKYIKESTLEKKIKKQLSNLTNLIMVVEDNVNILDSITFILELNDFDVITAKNGKDALEKLNYLISEDKKPDVIVSDIMMPEMDGYHLFRELSKSPHWNKIPFIFLTALVSPEDIKIGKMLGVDDYITKPFKEDDLLAIIVGKLAKLKKQNN